MPFLRLEDVPTEEVLPGVKVQFIYLKSTMFCVIEYAPGAAIPPHRHLHEQIALVIEGEIEATVGGETERVGAGGVVRAESNVIHSSKALENGAKVICASSPVMKPYKFEPEE